MSDLKSVVFAAALALMMPALAIAAHHEEPTASARAAAVVVEATVVAVDKETREVSLEAAHGQIVTMTLGPDAQRIDEISVGDAVIATYMQSLAAEVREPTAEELAEPWAELDAAAIAGADAEPGVAGLRMIRAVCTIEGMNRVTRSVMIKDPRGKFHLIGDVDPARLEGVVLGTQVIIVYSEAVALSLEKAGS